MTNNNNIDDNTGSKIYSLTSLKLNGLNVEYGVWYIHVISILRIKRRAILNVYTHEIKLYGNRNGNGKNVIYA